MAENAKIKKLLSSCLYYRGDDSQSDTGKFCDLERLWTELKIKDDPKILSYMDLVIHHGLLMWTHKVTPETPTSLIGVLLEDYLKDHKYRGELTIKMFMLYYLREYCKD